MLCDFKDLCENFKFPDSRQSQRHGDFRGYVLCEQNLWHITSREADSTWEHNTQTGSHLAQLNTVGFRAIFAKFNFVVVPKLSLSNLAT